MGRPASLAGCDGSYNWSGRSIERHRAQIRQVPGSRERARVSICSGLAREQRG